MGWGYWKPYVPVAQRRAQAQKAVAKAQKAGKDMQPVVIEGRTIARTFWGKAWCDNLEAYSDYENRLPRGRAYVRNGSVIDLKIEPGKILAQVIGSSRYTVEIGIAAMPGARWNSLVKECTGSIASLVELLQGKFSKAVMERLCQPKTGLFPAPQDIRLACSCPDWATMCKHVAAVLYGVGARLDTQPELLFTLRRVDPGDLVTQAALPAKTRKAPSKAKVLDEAGLADVFGIELADSPKTGSRKTRPAPVAAAKAKSSAKKTTDAVPIREEKPPRKTRSQNGRVPEGRDVETQSTARRKDPRAKPQPAPPAARGRKSPQAAAATRGRKKAKPD